MPSTADSAPLLIFIRAYSGSSKGSAAVTVPAAASAAAVSATASDGGGCCGFCAAPVLAMSSSRVSHLRQPVRTNPARLSCLACHGQVTRSTTIHLACVRQSSRCIGLPHG